MGLTDELVDALAADDLLAAVGGRPKDTGRRPFVIIWPDGPVRTPAKMNDPTGPETTVPACHCAGLSPDAAFIAERKLAAAVTALRGQVIDGRKVLAPVQGAAEHLRCDDDVDPPLYDLPVEWRIPTTAA